MKRIKYLLICFLSCIYATNSVAQCDHPDYEGLMELYNATNGDNWVNNDGWGDTSSECDPCKWFGVICKNNRVIELFLDNNGMTGTLPDLDLDSLDVLRLFQNKIGGSIPNFSKAKKLRNMALTSNIFEGSLPNFDSLAKLEIINLSYNLLSGTIPDFNNCNQLIAIEIAFNQLSGSIPEFNSLPHLTDIMFNNNFLATAQTEDKKN